jgi:hypothetical protein
MLGYVPLFITFALGVAGVWLKTKRDRTDGVVNQPTAGGWIVLVLLIVALGVGVVTERGKREGVRSAQRADSAKYASTIALLQSQLAQTAALSGRSDSSFRSQLALATSQLSFLRRLFLMQYELAGVEVSWKIRPPLLQEFANAVSHDEAPQRAGRGAESQRVYVTTAILHGRIDVWPTARGHAALRVMVQRPQGLYVRQFTDDEDEWRAFERALKTVISDRFDIQVAPGAFLADIARTHWPCRVSLQDGVIAFSIDRPGVRLGDLLGANVTVWAGDIDPARLPDRIRLRSTDSRLAFDRQLPLTWRRVPLYAFQASEEYTFKYANLTAGPFALPVQMDTAVLGSVGGPATGSDEHLAKVTVRGRAP